jgi:hypothetical protein
VDWLDVASPPFLRITPPLHLFDVLGVHRSARAASSAALHRRQLLAALECALSLDDRSIVHVSLLTEGTADPVQHVVLVQLLFLPDVLGVVDLSCWVVDFDHGVVDRAWLESLALKMVLPLVLLRVFWLGPQELVSVVLRLSEGAHSGMNVSVLRRRSRLLFVLIVTGISAFGIANQNSFHLVILQEVLSETELLVVHFGVLREAHLGGWSLYIGALLAECVLDCLQLSRRHVVLPG